MALDGLYQVVVKQNMFGKNIENVFFFQEQEAGGTESDVYDAFFSQYTVAMRNLQAQALNWTEVVVTNLGDLADFGSHPLPVTGLAGAGDVLPAFNAVGYTLKLATRGIRPGSKRIAGVLEAVVLNGVITEPTYAAQVEAFRLILDDPLNGTLVDYDPVVVKRVKEAVPDTTPVQYTYRLPKIGEVPEVGLIKAAFTNPNITSQTSRKD